MLRVDIRDLQRGPVRTVGQLLPDDPAFQGMDLNLAGPVVITGQLHATSPDEFVWRGKIKGSIQGECRRCLTDVETDVDIDVDAAVFSSDPEAAADPDFYTPLDRAHTSLWRASVG